MVVEHTFDILENEGVKFDFNDPVMMCIVKDNIKACFYDLASGKTVDFLGFAAFNKFNNGKEIIRDLEKLKKVLNAEFYRDTLENVLYISNKGKKHFDVVLIFKIIVLQILYDFSDEHIVKWIKSPALKWFLDYPEKYPSESTFWYFKEKLTDSRIIDLIWQKHQQQLDSYGFGFNKEIIEIAQDSKIITTDQGNYSAPRGSEAKTRRSRHGTRVKKGETWYFGYKIHQIMDLNYQLIRAFNVTTASAHDSQTTFSMLNKVIYGDKGYVGVKSNSYPAYMLRKSNDPLINEYRKQRNKRISVKRALVERPFSFLKQWKSDHVKTTTIPRTKIRMLIACMIFNIKQVITLQKQEKQNTNENKNETENFNYDLSLDFSILNGKAEKLRKNINKIRKRHKISRKNRKTNKYMYKKPKRYKKTNKDEKSNFKTFTIKKLDHTFYKI